MPQPTQPSAQHEAFTGDILVIDDEVPNLKLLTDILSGAGYQVRPTTVPHLALQAARTRPPDLILSDVRMPEMTGFEFCAALKQDEHTRDIPVIFVSALQDVEDRVRAFELGGVDFICKPFQTAEVLARVQNHLALRNLTLGLEAQVAERSSALVAANRALQAEIEEHNQAQAELGDTRRFNERLIETANTMILGLNTEGRVILANPAVERLTGFSSAELIGHNWFDLVLPDVPRNRVLEEFRRLLAGDEPKQFENAIRIRSGEERTISWSNSTIEEQGRIIGTLSVGIDVTERVQQQRRLEDYQRRLRELASELTLAEERERRRLAEELHDGPVQALAYTRMELSAARNQSETIARDKALDAVSDSLRETALAVSRVVADLSSPAMQQLGLMAAIADWAETHLEHRFGVTVTVTSHLSPAEEQQLSDLSRLILFRNTRELLANVAKHAQAQQVYVMLERAGEVLELTVQDDGQGCDPDTVLAASERAGGFGLFSIRERIGDLGGVLEIESEPGHGFTATLIVPNQFAV
jgi:PAS domain S-box-containing protein